MGKSLRFFSPVISLAVMTQGSLASYACHPNLTRGRLHREEESYSRSVFQRDRDRIIHSAAFRRLEYKTQVFINHEGDHYRTRLTHSLEVSQLSRSLCRALKLNEDLAEALALAHDLGHTPFGHAGEDALCEVMEAFGGFDHNAQALRILTALEHRYADFDGMNLTWETLEGIAKHNGPLIGENARKNKPVPLAIAEYNERHDLELHTFASAEAQAASLADDIAYNNHDIEDGIRAGFFTLDELRIVPAVRVIIEEVDALYPSLEERRRIHEVIRRVVNVMVDDLIAQAQENIRLHKVHEAEDVRALGRPLIHFSKEMEASNAILKDFLMKRMYRHYRVNRMASKARRMVKDLFCFFHCEPECLPTDWRSKADQAGSEATARLVCDFVAGMTDRFAIQEYQRVFDIQTVD